MPDSRTDLPFDPDDRAGAGDRRAFLFSLMAGAGAALLGGSGCTRRILRTPREFPAGAEAPLEGLGRFFTLRKGLAYLNTAALGSQPEPVRGAVVKATQAIDADPGMAYSADLEPVVDRVREKAAALLGVTAAEVAITHNATEGMSTVAAGLALESGDEVVTSSREEERSFLGWRHLEERRGIRIRTFTPPTPPEGPEKLVELVRSSLTPATRVVSLSHLSSATGLVYPLEEIAALVRPRGVFLVVDGAQPPGMLRIDLRKLGVDTYATSGHRWLLGPPGTGLLYVRREVQDEIRPLIGGGQGFRRGDARRYEPGGARNLAAVVGLGAALDFYRVLGPERVEQRVRYLASRLRRAVADMRGVRLLTSRDARLSCGVTAIGLEDADPRAAAVALRRQHQIDVEPLRALDLNGLRVSTHYYNTVEDVDRLGEALRGVV